MSRTPLTFDAHDKLGLKQFSEKLERFLIVEHDFVEGSLVVSLNAPFGAGKTTFLSMWKSDLDKRRKNDPAIPKAVVVNAWDSDYCGDPLLSLVDALIKAAGANEESKDAARLREAAKDVGWFVVGLANDLTSHLTGLDPVAAAELAEEKKKGRQPRVPDFVTLYEERTKALRKLKQTLGEIFGGEVPRIFLFIDELDRCRPDYAISYLETIKHVFDIHGLVFVLAVDYQQLECSAKALFGAELKFPDYFRKFVQRTIALPEPDVTKLQELANHYVRFYLEREGKRIPMINANEYCIEHIVRIVSALRMTPRQIQEAFRIIGHTTAGKPEQKGQMFWFLGLGVILMSALKVANPPIYRRIGKGDITLEEIGKFLTELLGKEHAKWWFEIYVTGMGRAESGVKVDLGKVFKELGFVGAEAEFKPDEALRDFARGWGTSMKGRW